MKSDAIIVTAAPGRAPLFAGMHGRFAPVGPARAIHQRPPPIVLSDGERELIRARLELSPREMDVVEALLADPLLNDRRITREVIARLLGIERSSVKTNIERMYRDIGVHDRVGLVVLVVMELLQLRHGTNEPNIPAAPED